MHRCRRWTAALTALMLALALLPMNTAAATQVDSAPLTVAASSRSGMVRVYLSSMGNPTALDMTVTGSYTAEGAAKVTLSSGDRVHVSFSKATGQMTMTVGGITYDMGSEMHLRRHQTTGQSGLSIDQSRISDNLYPGDLQLKAQPYSGAYRLYPILHVYIEYYLNGVVPYEMGNSAPLEALKAQAVAARTYTLNKMNIRTSALYDVVDTTNDQVYYGNSDTTARCTEAVSATKGIVLMNGDSLTETFYTASNGGQTESAANVWGTSGYDYLTIKDDPFDRMNAASVYRKVTVYADNTHPDQNAALKKLLQAKAEAMLSSQGYSTSGVSVMRINGVTPHTPKFASPSRLYTMLDFNVTVATESGNRELTLTFDIFGELETALGMSINASKNELWSVEQTGASFVLYARRYGHGVGMSQRGAMQMGSLGYTYDQILSFYYEGCKRVQYTFTHTILSSLDSGGSDTITTTETPADITPSSGVTAIVKLVGVSDKLAVRAAASASGTILTSVVNGGLVNVVARMDDWTMIRLGSLVGYVPTSALKFNGDPPTATDQTPTQISQWATVQCSGTLNLRSEGSMNASVLAAIPSGSILCVYSVQGSWAQVQYGASTGWASTDFLQMSSVYPGQVTGQLSGAAVVNIPAGSGTVNLRETASTSARVIATLSHGTQVTIHASDGSWCSVTTSGGASGYIMASFLAYDGSTRPAEPDTPAPDPSPELGQGEVEAIVHTASTALNLRAQPSTQSAVLAEIPRGESIVVTSRGGEWSAVRYGSVSGYVMTTYLRFPADEEASGDTPIGYATVATRSGSLNLRRQPSLGSTVIMQIPQGQRLGILQRLDGWCKVTYAGINGYVMTTYLAMEGSDTPEAALTGVVTTPSGALNLREAPSATARVLTSIAPGTEVSILTQGSEWSKITHGGYTGYVMTKFLTIGGSSASEPEAPADTGDTVTVRTGNGSLNLREAPDAASRVLTVIPDGTQLERLVAGSAWTKVRYGSHTGYVMTKFLKEGTSSGDSTQAQEISATVSTPDGGGLNMRASADRSAQVLQVIPSGTAVTVLEKGDTWCRITCQGREGYVMTRYLRLGQAAMPDARTGWIVPDVTGGVNLRYMPDTSGQVLAVLAPGTEVTVTLDGEVWSVVKAGDTTGYVMSRYITFTRPAQQEEIRYVNAPSGGLNLRQGASASAAVILSIPHGAQVTLLQAADDTWSQVRYGERTGYVASRYLSASPTGPAATATSVPAGQQPVYDETLYTLTGWEAIVSPREGNVNLRAWCATSAPVRLAIPKGAVVRLLEFGDTWCRVVYGEVEGYCMTEYLTLREME
ncbi:MAG: SH3 domain-containing protein [Aristaeellaceae bacterium]